MTEEEYKEVREKLWELFRRNAEYGKEAGESSSYEGDVARATAANAAVNAAGKIMDLEEFWSKQRRRDRQPD